jgi:ABC-type multidrug transport system fused ATPase/permease subunit
VDKLTPSRDGTVALDSISFEVKAGQKVGICGRTGCGKSTFISVLLHLLVPQEGTLLIDNLPVTKISRTTARDRFICLPQDALTFPRSFQFNLDPEYRVTDELEFTNALKAVDLMELVTSRGGLQADIGQLSHGQQQLLALARAIVRKRILGGKCILVLDEATSNLDSATEEVMRKVIAEQFKENTVISVAHRLDTIKDADLILVFEQGQILKTGPPDDVL